MGTIIFKLSLYTHIFTSAATNLLKIKLGKMNGAFS